MSKAKTFIIILALCTFYIIIPNKKLKTYSPAMINKQGSSLNILQRLKKHNRINIFYKSPLHNPINNNSQEQPHIFKDIQKPLFLRGISWQAGGIITALFKDFFKPGESIFNNPLFAILKTLLLLIFIYLIWRLINFGFDILSKHTEIIKRKFPDLENNLNMYLKMIKKVLNLSIFILAMLILLQIWGLDVFLLILNYSAYISTIIRIPLILGIAIALIQVSKFIINKLVELLGNRMKSRPGAIELEIQKQIKTIGDIIYKTIFVIILIIAAMMIMNELGFDIKPILASVGVVSLAVGFGAQNLVRDVLSGLFMIIENQIRVGDYATLNGTSGLVEAINLRTTALRGLDGSLHIFPNGTINTLSNLTHNFSYYLFEIGVAYKEDVDHVIEVLKKIGDEIMHDSTYGREILEPLEILGLDKFSDSAVIIKARIKTKPIKQWMVGREMNYRIKKMFDNENIEIPFPHRTLYFGDASKAFDIRLKSYENNKEIEYVLKKWIKEILAENARNEEQKKD